MVLCGIDIAEGRCGGNKVKKGKAEGVQIESPSKGNKGKIGVQSPGKKGKIGVQSPGKKGKKGVQSLGKKGKGVESTGKKRKGVESTDKKGKCIKKKCVQNGCTFRLWASWMQNESCFQIKTLIPEHCCSRNFDLGSLVTYKWIAKQFAFKIIKDPTISYRSIQELTKKKFLINVSISQCKRAKQRALFDHEGGLIEHYSRLWDYRQQLLDTNHAMKEGWSAGCRKVIGLDGCFLKGTVKGELLTAMRRDGNNQMFPIAWVVVNIENNDNWHWFLACIYEDLMLHQGAYLTIILDGHKWLVDKNPNSWCRAFFKMDRGCGAYENGISESYHNSIRIARGKLIITMLEEIRVYLMQRLYSMNNLASNLADTITPSIRKQIEHLKITQRYWTVCLCGDNNYEVRKGDESFGVNIEKRICSCNWWTFSGVPCVHTVAAYCFLKTDPALGRGSSVATSPKKDARPRKLRIKHVTERDNPKPTNEKKKPRRKKAGDAGPSTTAGSATVVDESGPTGVDESGQTVVDESDVEVQIEATITEDLIQEFENGIPTQTSRTSMKEVVEASIAAGTLKLAGVKRRSKSERIANKAKAFKFRKDGAGSSADKAWDVDEACFCSMYYWALSPVTLRFDYGGYSRMVKNEDGFLCHGELLVSFLFAQRSMKVDLEIMTRSTVKPASPTPHHLKHFKLSILDQMMHDVYTPLILFIPNSDKASVNDVITKRSKHLKESLSRILTQFYPIAGQVKDSFQIECNDNGVYYIEARVNDTLEDFLSNPEDEKVRALNPESPTTEESSIGNFVIGIQVNIFNCGGIGLSTSLSHKIFDGHTYFTFMKAWAAAARGSPETLSPSFAAYEVFPNNPCLESMMPGSKSLITTKLRSTKRFLFNSTALARLKSKPVACSSSLTSRGPTRLEATSGVIWKAASKAASSIRRFGPETPHAFVSSVNLRKRATPPLPSESIGNIVDLAVAFCFPESQPDLATLMGQIRESIAKKDSNHIESMKGEKGLEKINEMLRESNHVIDVVDIRDCIISSSLLNSGIYEMDFGWGKPIWFYNMHAGVNRFVFLNDTPKGGGVEATVTLSPDEMEIFQRDSELLSYAIVDPNPLQYLQYA
ncbi:vinorine synthase-like protein [Tanacetum coccineum]